MTNRYVIRIHPDGESELISCSPKGTLTLKTLQRLVGGRIETVPTVMSDGWAHEEGARVVMLVNEEGRILNMAHNETATIMAGFSVGTIVGPALIMAARRDELFGLTAAAVKKIKIWLKGDD